MLSYVKSSSYPRLVLFDVNWRFARAGFAADRTGNFPPNHALEARYSNVVGWVQYPFADPSVARWQESFTNYRGKACSYR
ncbi:hypothetical protein V2G26_014616 [Clonostachys chloroleuca]